MNTYQESKMAYGGRSDTIARARNEKERDMDTCKEHELKVRR